VRSGAAKCERSTRGSPGKVDGKLGCAGSVDERKRESQGKHSWPQSRSSDGGIGSGGPLERWSQYCILGLDAETLAEGQLRTTQEDVGEFFPALAATCGSHRSGSSPGLGAEGVITEWGHEVLVANPRLMEGAKRRKRKGDRIDADKLARLGRVEPQSLYPIRHRCREVRQDLVVLRARDALVSMRTELINTTRGPVKSMGTRLPRCSSPSFADKVKDAIPVEVREALLPLVRLVETVNDCIARYDQKIERLGREKYRHATLLRQVKGVGPITSLAYVLTLADPQRSCSRREVTRGLWLLSR